MRVLGLLTRSTIAALIITGLFWFALFAANTTESALLSFRTMQEQRVAAFDRAITQERARIDAEAAAAQERPAPTGILNTLRQNIVAQEGREQRSRSGCSGSRTGAAGRRSVDSVAKWHNGSLVAKTLLPKTQETIALTERVMIDLSALTESLPEEGETFEGLPSQREDEELGVVVDSRDVQRELLVKQRSRSAWWIVGTSLIFEAVVLAIACLIFSRRDY